MSTEVKETATIATQTHISTTGRVRKPRVIHDYGYEEPRDRKQRVRKVVTYEEVSDDEIRVSASLSQEVDFADLLEDEEEEASASTRSRRQTKTVKKAATTRKSAVFGNTSEEDQLDSDDDTDIKSPSASTFVQSTPKRTPKNLKLSKSNDIATSKKEAKSRQVLESLQDTDSGNNVMPDTKPEKGKKAIKPHYDPKAIAALAKAYPDQFWKHDANSNSGMLEYINADHPLTTLPVDVSDQGSIMGMTLSSDGALLVTFSNVGSIRIWDVENEFKLLCKLRDKDETHIDEYYCGNFAPDFNNTSRDSTASEPALYLAVGGKLKDRHRWSAEDEDNHILPCPIKVFNVLTGKVVARLEGHAEEILTVKALSFKGENYFISTSQDGYIWRWHMSEDWTTLLDSRSMADGITCMAFTVSFIPNTGNKYFMAACDEHLKLYDFENAQLLQTFEEMYSSYCDCIRFINWVDDSEQEDVLEDKENRKLSTRQKTAEANENSVPSNDASNAPQTAWFITRGVELLDAEDNSVATKPNTCALHRLVYPVTKNDVFRVEEVKRFQHEDYHSNSWLVKIASNGRYLMAPTLQGQVFCFNILTGEVSAILKDHEDIEVRDLIFHPTRPELYTCADDGNVKIYTLADPSEQTGNIDITTSANPSEDEKGVKEESEGAEAFEDAVDMATPCEMDVDIE